MLFRSGFIPDKYLANRQGMLLIDYSTGIYNRVKPNSIYVLRNAVSPAVILECGFVVNPEEEKKLSEIETRQRIIDAVNEAIAEYFSNNK